MKTDSVSATHPETPRDVNAATDPAATRALYARLDSCGPAGQVALNLFRAHRCITQAMNCDPEYRQHTRQISRKAYERKDWALRLLCRALMDHSVELRIPWGWSCDSRDKRAPWSLHIDLPQGQVVFRNPCRLTGYDYVGRRDNPDKSEERIIAYCDEVLNIRNNHIPRLF
jgi:hypothetical protein